MAKKFVWHYGPAGDVFLRSREIARECEAAAQKMTRATGMDYQFETGQTTQRVIVEGKGEDEED